MRYFFEVAYKGTDFHGWQSQKNANSVQSTIEKCCSLQLREDIKIVGSGRTDTGVHCQQQYFHADINQPINNDEFLYSINSFLPNSIVIRAIHQVNEGAHARFDAYERSYEYRISRVPDPFLMGMAWMFYRPLDVDGMNKAAELLIGEQDFESFSKVKTDVNTFICNVKQARWIEQGNILTFHVTANRFLRGMVRALTGTLIDVGEGKISVGDFKDILLARDRKRAGAAAPAGGLFLVSVKYPEDIIKQ